MAFAWVSWLAARMEALGKSFHGRTEFSYLVLTFWGEDFLVLKARGTEPCQNSAAIRTVGWLEDWLKKASSETLLAFCDYSQGTKGT